MNVSSTAQCVGVLRSLGSHAYGGHHSVEITQRLVNSKLTHIRNTGLHVPTHTRHIRSVINRTKYSTFGTVRVGHGVPHGFGFYLDDHMDNAMHPIVVSCGLFTRNSGFERFISQQIQFLLSVFQSTDFSFGQSVLLPEPMWS